MFLFQLLVKTDLFQPVKRLNMTQVLCSESRSLAAVESAGMGYTALALARGIVNISSPLRGYCSLALVVSWHEKGRWGSESLCPKHEGPSTFIGWDWTFQVFISFSVSCAYVFCSFMSLCLTFLWVFMGLRILWIIVSFYISCIFSNLLAYYFVTQTFLLW